MRTPRPIGLARRSTTPGAGPGSTGAVAGVRFMTLDPGHFHAALVQKEMYPGVSPQVDVYAPLGPDLLGHLARVDCVAILSKLEQQEQHGRRHLLRRRAG